MKKSIYNLEIEANNEGILYNTFSGEFIKLTPEIRKCLNGDASCNEVLMKELENRSFIIQDDINEKEMIKSIRLQKRFSPKMYLLILNTTIDCNLNCWYCYENHSTQTYMSLEMVQRILRHIDLMHKILSFDILDLTFFGGEPMMNYKAISTLLEGANKLSQENGYKLSLTIVTNGTFISDKYITLLKPFSTRFQITLDGDKQTHNSIRKFKDSFKKDSYSHVIDGLKKLNVADADFKFVLRVNYDDKVLNNMEGLIKDLSFMKRDKCVITLQKVWQCNEDKIDINQVFKVIEIINNAGFCLNSYRFRNTFSCCNTDNFNQAIINYDGKVFKCTARDFTDKEAHGYLNNLGIIEWNTELIKKRLALNIPHKCLDCIFLPSCPGICTQKIIENTKQNDIPCPFPFNKGVTKEDIVLLNIKQRLIAQSYSHAQPNI